MNQLLIGREYLPVLIEAIEEARQTIDVMMFDWRWYMSDFSCDVQLLNQALVRAMRRKVKIRAYVSKGKVKPRLEKLGFIVKECSQNVLMHGKVCVIDRKIIVLGSHNWTTNAMTKNVEVSLIEESEPKAARFLAYFETLWQL